jgi:uncharacterized protein YecE (DUF72 family)
MGHLHLYASKYSDRDLNERANKIRKWKKDKDIIYILIMMQMSMQ